MKFTRLFVMLALFVAMTTMLSACRPPKAKNKGGVEDPSEDVTEAPAKKLTAIKAGSGTIKGKVVLDGTQPSLAKLTDIINTPQCFKCQVPKDKLFWDADQKWIAGSNKGLANVFVRLKVPEDHYFLPADVDRKRTDTVVDQPCCAYEPHVFVVYPSYFDGNKQVPTGQELMMKNSAGFNHNTVIAGDQRLGNSYNQTITPASEHRFVLSYQSSEVNVSCSIHGWMKAKMWIVDNPYAVATPLDGTFEMKNVPVGVPLTLEFWHEDKGFFKTEQITLTPNEVKTVDVSVTK